MVVSVLALGRRVAGSKPKRSRAVAVGGGPLEEARAQALWCGAGRVGESQARVRPAGRVEGKLGGGAEGLGRRGGQRVWEEGREGGGGEVGVAVAVAVAVTCPAAVG